MKKLIVLISFLALAIVSCKQKTKNEIKVSYQPETKNEIKYDFLQIFNSRELLDLNKKNAEPKEKYAFYKHLFLVTTFEDLKNSAKKDLIALKKYSDKTLIELSKIINYEYISIGNDQNMDSIPSNTGLLTRNQINTKLDSTFSSKKYNLSKVMHDAFVGPFDGGTNIESIKENIVTILRQFGMGASYVYTYVLVENNNVTNLGQVYDHLSKSEYNKLERDIKKVANNYIGMCERSGTAITKKGDNYLISFTAYQNEDAACCPSLSVSYETKDFKNLIPNSVIIKLSK